MKIMTDIEALSAKSFHATKKTYRLRKLFLFAFKRDTTKTNFRTFPILPTISMSKLVELHYHVTLKNQPVIVMIFREASNGSMCNAEPSNVILK